MTGKHSRAGIFRTPVGIVATAAVATAVTIGGAFGAIQLTSAESGAAPVPVESSAGPVPTLSSPATGAPAASPSASPSASPKVTRSPQRASRATTRTAAPRPTPKVTKTTAKPVAPKVLESGSCGASFYSEGQLTANGETFDPSAMTAAHKTLPFGTKVRVTNPSTGDSVTVRINDRGPFIDGRCLDLSRAAFAAIASLDLGHLTVRYEVLG
ncbi:septal ring lytic transglycosylase RlpA family protein [Micromonospora echinofusca]|uniref:septal ring lytic transglycosylase RlpA family protein n=1 Tax=Micromonospora echinofusca TaxID=47858 RepID=UPI0027DE7FFA|nr:septal ring lytic transglycosylase RlpA family protein [Micromonospora echinofusca]